jgi:hypothetical protein
VKETPAGIVRFRIKVISAADVRHSLLTSAQLEAIWALLVLNEEVPS